MLGHYNCSITARFSVIVRSKKELALQGVIQWALTDDKFMSIQCVRIEFLDSISDSRIIYDF